MAEKSILIIDEAGFSRICSAILESEGYRVEAVTDGDNLASKLNNEEIVLIITSCYPYGILFLEDIKKRNIPVIILSDLINKELINILERFNSSYCMVKPLDYQKFKRLVRKIVNGDLNNHGEYNIVIE